jgi:hypothetical protein
MLRSVFVVLDPAQPSNDVKLQRLERTLQGAQEHYEDVLQVEDDHLKTQAKTARQSEAKKLGTATTSQAAAKLVVDNLTRVRADLELQGTIHPIEPIISFH